MSDIGITRRQIVGLALAAGLAGFGTGTSAGNDDAVGVGVPAVTGIPFDFVECVAPARDPASGNESALVDVYLRFHADVRAEATIVGLPRRGTTGDENVVLASHCAGGEYPGAGGQVQIQSQLARTIK